MRVLFPGVAFCLAIAALGAQQPTPASPSPTSQTPVFRTGTTLVPVDVRVLDRNGKPVVDLKQEDFSVFEDKTRQEIRHFSAQGLVAEAPGPGAALVPRKATDALTLRNSRIFLLVLGRGRLQPPSNAIDAAIKFVRTHLLPQDQVAVLAYNRGTDFTTSHEQIAKLLDRYKTAHEGIETSLREYFSGLRAVYGSKDMPKFIQDKIDAIFDAPGAPGARTLTPQMATDTNLSNDQRATIDALQTAQIVANSANPTQQGALKATDLATAANAGASLDDFVSQSVSTNQDLSKLYAGIQYLRNIDGEKHLVFFTEFGLRLPRLEDSVSVASAANDARVAIDTIETGGATAPSAPPGRGMAPLGMTPQLATAFSVRDLATVAELTGGVSSAYSYGDKAVAAIDQATTFEYLLGYYPTNPTLDDRYRRITVKVNRPGMTVLFRHGYFSREALAPMDRDQIMRYSRVSSALNYAQEVHDIKLTVKASAVTSGTDRAVDLHIGIDPSRISLIKSGDQYSGAIDIAIFCGDTRQATVGDSWHTVDLMLTETAYQRFKQVGLTVTEHVPVTRVAGYAKVVVYDARADLLGTAMVTVR